MCSYFSTCSSGRGEDTGRVDYGNGMLRFMVVMIMMFVLRMNLSILVLLLCCNAAANAVGKSEFEEQNRGTCRSGILKDIFWRWCRHSGDILDEISQ